MIAVAKTNKKAKAPKQAGPSPKTTDQSTGTLPGADGNGQAHAGPSAEELRKELAAKEGERDKVDRNYSLSPATQQERRRRIEGEMGDLRGRIAVAEVNDLPMPAAGPTSTISFDERDVPIATIRLTGNHREEEDPAALARLGRLLQTLGLQQRVGLRANGDGSYELIFGSRRLAAAKSIGWTQIPAKVYPHTLTPADVEIIRTVENFGRKDLTPVERAIAVARTIEAVEGLLKRLDNLQTSDLTFDDALGLRPTFKPADDLKAAAELKLQIDAAGGIHAYVGQQLGFPARWVKDNDYVSKLGGDARKLLASGRLGVEQARELAKLGDKSKADNIARQAARSDKGTGGETVEWVRNRVNEQLRSLRYVWWRLDVAFGKDEKAGCAGHACATCPFNSKTDPDLFNGSIADEPDQGVCTNAACFEAKQKATEAQLTQFVARARVEVKRNGMALTERGMSFIIPSVLRPAAAVRRAKKLIDPETGKEPASKPRPSSNGHAGGNGERKETPEERAKRKYEHAQRQWAEGFVDAVRDALAEQPGRFAAFELLQSTRFFGSIQTPHWQPKPADIQKAAAAASSDRAAENFNVLAKPTLEGLLKLEKDVDWKRQFGFGSYEIGNLAAPAVTAIGVALGVDTSRRPKLDDFVAAEKAKPPAKDAKGKKGKAVAAAEGDDGEEGDDDA
jgi:hypothetical protein